MTAGHVRCQFCPREFVPDPFHDFRRIVGWERKNAKNRGGSDIFLREGQNDWACAVCINQLRAGVNVRQETLI